MSAHSVLAPSSSFRWVVCPGSVKLSMRYPELEESESAREGTAAHHIGAEDLLGRPVALGSQAPNGVILTEEMFEGAEVWIEDVQGIAALSGVPEQLQVEQRATMPRIHPEAFGTPDTWLFIQEIGHLYVWDFKFGHGIVEVHDNWQLIMYACGILDLLGIDGRNDQHIWIHLRIVQPRAYHRDGPVREWTVLASDLRSHFNKLQDAAHEAMGPNPHTQSGPHCLHCPAAASCKTLQRATWSAADYLSATVADDLSAEAAAYELQLLEHIEGLCKARKNAREASVSAMLRKGQAIPAYTLENSQGRTTYRPEKLPELLALIDILGLDMRKPDVLLTPKQAEKKGVDMSVIADYIHTPSNGLKLVRDTNMLIRARAAFGKPLEQ